MFAAAFAMLVIGYAAAYSGASNLFTGGKGWGFLQSLLNKGKNSDLSGVSSLVQSAATDTSTGVTGSAPVGGGSTGQGTGIPT